MTDESPYDGVRELAAHDGLHAPPFGETVWLLEDNGTLWGVWNTRHDAVAARAKLKNTNCYKEEWFNLLPVPVGAVRMNDIRWKSDIEALGGGE